jgi:hypothetical protein
VRTLNAHTILMGFFIVFLFLNGTTDVVEKHCAMIQGEEERNVERIFLYE